MFKKILIIFLTFSLIACQSDSKEEEKPAELNEIDSKFSFVFSKYDSAPMNKSSADPSFFSSKIF